LSSCPDSRSPPISLSQNRAPLTKKPKNEEFTAFFQIHESARAYPRVYKVMNIGLVQQPDWLPNKSFGFSG